MTPVSNEFADLVDRAIRQIVREEQALLVFWESVRTDALFFASPITVPTSTDQERSA